MEIPRFSKAVSSFGAIAILAMSAQFSPISISSAYALPGIRNCSDDLQTRLVQAKKFLIENQKILADDFEIHARGGQERRSRRQILRRVEKMNFTCKADDNCDTHSAVQGTIVGGNRIRMCEALLADASFCTVVEYVAHEFGHNAHIPRARAGRHNRRGHDDPDRVYQFGYFAGELCKDVYGLGFNVGDGSTPRRTPGLVAPKDLIVYPRKQFEGYPFHFSVMVINNDYPSDRIRDGLWRYRTRNEARTDLRKMGFAENISSVKVNRGRWEICTKKDYGGTCKVIDRNYANLSDIKMNNKISSVRYLGD